MDAGLTWLAIDDAGFLGAFGARAGELVPRSARWLAAPDRFELDVLRAARAIDLGRCLPASAPPRRGARVLVVIDPRRVPRGSYRSGIEDSGFEQALAGRWIVVREAAPRILATLGSLDFAREAALLCDATVVRVVDERRLAEWIDLQPDSGLFSYATTEGTPDQLARRVSPAHPIHIHELSPTSRDRIRHARFPIRFEAERTLALRDHFDGLTTLDPARPHVSEDPVAEQRCTHLAIALGVAVTLHALLTLLLR